MALFKIFKGSKDNLGVTGGTDKVYDGYAYFTPDNGKFYIDVVPSEGQDGDPVNPGINRIPLSADKADRDDLGNIIKNTYAASLNLAGHTLTLIAKDGTTVLTTITLPDNNTTYTFANGTNGFTVTPSGGSAQTVTVTPSITNNITGSGTSDYLTKFNGTNTITNGPQLSSAISSQSQTTKFLREDGTWAAPSYTTNTNTTYTFADGNDGSFTVTPAGGSAQTVSIGKPATAGTADVANSVAWSNVQDPPSTYTPSSHSHGNITNGGDITAAAPTIANGDQIVINDHSASKITNGPTFDGSTTTQYLSKKGTWEDISDTLVAQTAMDSSDVSYKLLTTTYASPTSGDAYGAKYSTNLAYNPSTNKLSTVNMDLTGALNVTGDTHLYGASTIDSLAVGTLQVNGNSRFINDVAFTNIPTAPTAAAGTSDTKLATTAFVANSIASLSTAMHFIGKATVAITDGSTTNPSISGYDFTADRKPGDVIIDKDNSYEYVWTLEGKWERLGPDGSYKTTQSAVDTGAATTNKWVSRIQQNANGEITATLSSLDTTGTWSGNATTATTASKLGSSTLGSTTKPIYLSSGTATECSTYAGGTAVTLNGSSKGASTASFYAPTASGTENQILVSAGANASPTWKATANGAAYATGANGALTFGTLPIAQGGTGATNASDALANLGGQAQESDYYRSDAITTTPYIYIKTDVTITDSTTYKCLMGTIRTAGYAAYTNASASAPGLAATYSIPFSIYYRSSTASGGFWLGGVYTDNINSAIANLSVLLVNENDEKRIYLKVERKQRYIAYEFYCHAYDAPAINRIISVSSTAPSTDAIENEAIMSRFSVISTASMPSTAVGNNGVWVHDHNYVKQAALYAYTAGTSSVGGVTILSLGNNQNATSEGNSKGRIVLYGENTAYTYIESKASSYSGKFMYLPDYNGSGYLTHVSGAEAVGSATQPVYVAANGRITTTTYSLGASVPSNAVFTDTDTKVYQSASTTANWRKILLHYKDDSSSTTAVTASTDQVYAAVGVSVQPSTGAIRATKYNVADGVELQYNSTLQALNFVFA